MGDNDASERLTGAAAPSVRSGPPSPVREFVIYRADGTLERIVARTFNVVEMSWSPDGRWLAFSSVLSINERGGWRMAAPTRTPAAQSPRPPAPPPP